MSEIELGVKIGSQNTAVARRNESGKIELVHTKTCVRYPKGILKREGDKPIVGEAAMEFVDAISPLRLGVVENVDGIAQLVDILGTLSLPTGARMVLASPAVQMKEGNNRLAEAIKQVCDPASLVAFSEGLCSAAWLSGTGFINTSAIFSLNLGSTTLEVGCFHEGNEVHLSAHPEVCGDRVDKAIANRIGNLVGDVIVSEKKLRDMKEGASLLSPKTYTVEGMTRQGKKEVQVSEEIVLSLKEYADTVATVFCAEVMGVVNTNVRNMALKSPLLLSGGMSNIEGLPGLIGDLIFEKMHHKFEISCSKENDNHHIAAKGALLLAEEIAKESGEKI